MRLYLLFCAMAGLVAAQHQALVRNPHSSQEDVAAGGRIYHSHCAECHGLKGEGGRGPDLTRGEYRHGSTDAKLFKTIDDGIPGTQMPGVYFEEVQIWQIVAFVRSLAAGGSRATLPGDKASGEKLFFGKAGCTGCHMVNGRGGRFGPDLSDAGSARTAHHLRTSILKPNEDLPNTWWKVDATDRSGRTYSGLRMNEDTYSIQILDKASNLLSLNKATLTRLQIDSKKSVMPSYAGKLTDAEVDDLVVYLYSLQRKGREEE